MIDKAGVVKRSEATGQGGFVVKAYSAYSPKMFAGISEIDDLLQDRTVRVSILRKKDNETVQRYKGTAEIIDLQRSIRDDLYVFGLTFARDIAEFYYKEGPDGIEGLSHLTNRELDIWEPIFLLANVVDASSRADTLTRTMEELSKKSLNEKQSDSVSQNETYKILTVLKSMLDEVAALSADGDIRVFGTPPLARRMNHSSWIFQSAGRSFQKPSVRNWLSGFSKTGFCRRLSSRRLRSSSIGSNGMSFG